MLRSPGTTWRVHPALLYKAINDKRLHQGKTWKQVGRETGISAQTFTRLYYGRVPTANAVVTMLLWSGTPLSEVTRHAEPAQLRVNMSNPTRQLPAPRTAVEVLSQRQIAAQATAQTGLHPDDHCRRDW